MKQSDIFIQGEGAAWLQRNEAKLPVKDDPVLDTIKACRLEPKKVLEVGCANGWRLLELVNQYKCSATGIDPCIVRINSIKNRVLLLPGIASNLAQFRDGHFDLVIYGFCLYLCDPEDYFKIATEGDRVLADGGRLIIYDFYAPFPYSVPYEHKEGVFTHKMDFSNLWRSHPAYSMESFTIIGQGDDTTVVFVLKKNMRHSFPVKS